MSIATIIADTIGARALYLIGAKNLIDIGDGLTFKIGRNPGRAGGKGGVTHITVKLNASDTYDVEFVACRGTSLKVRAAHAGIYCDGLHRVIEAETGLVVAL